MKKRTLPAARKPALKSKAAPAPLPPLAKGQKWQLLLGCAEIVHVGKFLLDYRFHKVENQRRVPLETSTIREFSETLQKNNAQLVTEIAE